MKRLLASLLAVVLLAAATASAQTKPTFSLGARGGANLARTTLDPTSNTSNANFNFAADKSAIYAWQAGLVGEVAFGKLALQPALLFTQKGEHFSTTTSSRDSGFPYYEESNSTNRYNWLELPLNLVYTLHGDHGLQILAGPYVALAVGGRQQVEGSSSGVVGPYSYNAPLKYGPSTYNRRFDAGFNAGLGYRQGPVQVQLSYGIGLVNLHVKGINYPVGTTYYDPYKAHNRVLQLTGSYFLKL
jgi:hypothetical protein